MVLYEMLQLALYEVVIASGIGVVLVAATIGGLIARVMMGPEELAFLREAREMRADMGDLTRRIRSRATFAEPGAAIFLTTTTDG